MDHPYVDFVPPGCREARVLKRGAAGVGAGYDCTAHDGVRLRPQEPGVAVLETLIDVIGRKRRRVYAVSRIALRLVVLHRTKEGPLRRKRPVHNVACIGDGQTRRKTAYHAC